MHAQPQHQPASVLILHSEPIVAIGLATALGVAPPRPLAEVPAAEVLLASVVVADYEQALTLLRLCRNQFGARPPRILVVTGRDSTWEIRHALERGVLGYVLYGGGLDELRDTVAAVGNGVRRLAADVAMRLADSVCEATLTSREMDVLQLLAAGQCNKSIAKGLDITAGTVKSHLKAIFTKFNATSRTEVAALAERRGLFKIPAAAPAHFSAPVKPQRAAAPHALAGQVRKRQPAAKRASAPATPTKALPAHRPAA